MKPKCIERVKNTAKDELRLGIASWDDGTNSERSLKYAWRDKNGHVARGGELPVEALPQALDFAIRNGYVRRLSRKQAQRLCKP